MDAFVAGFAQLDGWLFGGMPRWLGATLWGAVSGALGIVIYALLSNQDKLRAIGQRVVETRMALVRYDGPAEGLAPLVKASLGSAMAQLRMVLLPTLVGSLPILAILIGVEHAYPFGDASWWAAWPLPYFLAMLVVALGIKIGFKIK